MGVQVLVNEEEIVSEDMRNKPAPAVQPGDRAFQKHLSKIHHHHCPLLSGLCRGCGG